MANMTYVCTLLKELPDYPVGTQFIIMEGDKENSHGYYCKFPGDRYMLWENYKIPKSAIDNPEWVKKTVDESCLTELKCSNCGSTKLLLQTYHAPSSYDDGVRYYKMGIRGVCPCGNVNEYINFVTHTTVERW